MSVVLIILGCNKLRRERHWQKRLEGRRVCLSATTDMPLLTELEGSLCARLL
jgi:hypothetical protein